MTPEASYNRRRKTFLTALSTAVLIHGHTLPAPIYDRLALRGSMLGIWFTDLKRPPTRAGK